MSERMTGDRMVSRFALACAFAGALVVGRFVAAADDSSDVVGVVINLLGDKDKDVRAIGLQQVREEAKGNAATKQFAAALPKLAPDAQAALLRALGDRGDAAARPAVLDMLKSSDESVRAAALFALGPLGTTDDVVVLIRALDSQSKAEKQAAHESLVRMSGDAASRAIIAALPSAKPAVRADLIAILTARRAGFAAPQVVTAALDNDAVVRTAAMSALAQLGKPDDVPAMLRGVLKASSGEERAAAER
ncbi:MAG TPA: HEAT repeat domain-containing protein, partial [Pirellulales bacterium]|nr:HEAT repeat domain-containing protein [Pirellulales bacterium]